MKKNNKGFLLVETLVVSTFCLTVLVILFLQFRTLIVNYNKSFKYNTVEGIYNLNTMKNYFKKNEITFSNTTYIYYNNNGTPEYDTKCINFCQEIVQALEPEVIIYTGSNIDVTLKTSGRLSNEMKDFISQLKNDNKGNRLIAEFKGGTYASITY